MVDRAVADAVPVERRTETGDAARQSSWSSSSSCGLAAARRSPTAPVLAAKTAANRYVARIVNCRAGHLRRAILEW